MDPVTDQIVGTLRNMRQEISTRGITAEADALWQHALQLYRMRRTPLPASAVDVSTITEYGMTQKLSCPVRCF